VNGLEAVFGYAIGTIQILLVDWWRKVAAHRRQLRLLRSELIRLSKFSHAFNWIDGLPPEDDSTPLPPSPSELFVHTIGEMDFALTDEHSTDNFQESLLHLVDGCNVLGQYRAQIFALMEKSPGGHIEVKERFVEDTPRLAAAYDRQLVKVLFQVDGSIREVDRRLELLTVSEQFSRAFADLPRGTNPPDVSDSDPRLEEWRRTRVRRGST
jgi:hypothetical protein